MKERLEVKDKTNHTEGLKIAPFRQHIRKTSPHKHNNYFEIIYLTHGSGTHTIDAQSFEIAPPIVFTIRKEQVHYWEIQSRPEGFVIIIKKEFISHCLDQDIKRLIAELSAQNCLFPNDNSAMQLFQILHTEFEKYNTNSLVIEGLLKALLAKLLESQKPIQSKGAGHSTFLHFMDLLAHENQLINKVQHYADLLHTTPQNLNAICRKETGQSASTVLAEHIINEASRLLIYTDFTVSEIAHQLDFKDNSHFSKYFKKHTELTPSNFRKEMG